MGTGQRTVRPRAAKQTPLIAQHADDEAAQLLQPEQRKCRRCSDATGADVLHPVSAFRRARRKDGTVYYRPDCRAASWRHDAEKAESDLTREALDKVQQAVTRILSAYGISASIDLRATVDAA